MRSLIICFSLFCFIPGLAQSESVSSLWQKGNAASGLSEFEKSLLYYQKAFDKAHQEKNFHWQANICVDQCGSLFGQGKYQEAIDKALEGLLILKKNKITNDSVEFKLHSALSSCYKPVYRLNDSFRSFEEASRILHRNPSMENTIPLYVTYHYANQGGTWYSLADSKRALLYFEKALAVASRLKHKNDFAFVLNKLSGLYEFQKDFPKAISNTQTAIKHYKIDGKTIYDYHFAKMHYNLADYYTSSGNYDAALKFISEVRRILIKVNPSKKTKELFTKTRLLEADNYLKLNQSDKAENIFKDILSKNTRGSFYDSDMSYMALIGLSKVEKTRNRPDIALKHLQWALSEISGEKIRDDISNPKEISSTYQVIGVTYLLDDKVELLIRLFEQTKEVRYLKAALDTQQFSVTLAKRLRQSHETLESRMLYSHVYYRKYESLLEISYRLFELTGKPEYITYAYEVMEESKSLALSDKLSLHNNYRNTSSDSLREKFRANQAYLSYLKSTQKEATEQINAYELKVNEILEKLSTVNQSFAESYKSETKTDLQAFRKNLPSNALYLNYIAIRNDIYILGITKTKISLKKIQVNPADLEKYKKSLLLSLSSNPGPYAGFKGSKEAAYFYQILIKPLENEMSGIKKLVINPANEILDISFDILSADGELNKALVHRYSISYLNSSVNYNDELKNKFSFREREWLSFAPFGNTAPNKNHLLSIQNITTLPSTLKEIKGIKGMSFTNENATKKQFLNSISNEKQKIILLSTHAAENDGEPFLSFYPSGTEYRLYASEIQYLDYNSPLIILGACESNAGKKMKGSGVLSLAKAFSVAGCSSVVASLWEVHDESMAALVSLFYKHLMQGEHKDEALRNAKLDFLQTEVGRRNDPPYYWAHLQIIGDTSPVVVWPVVLKYSLYAIIAVIILAGIYYLRKNKALYRI